VKYLVDTNIWLEMLLGREKANEVRQFILRIDSRYLVVTEFSLYSLGIILTRLKKDQAVREFLKDLEQNDTSLIRLDTEGLKGSLILRQKHELDFDDAYQYAVAEKYDLIIVSFDKDFDKTPRGRKTPAEV